MNKFYKILFVLFAIMFFVIGTLYMAFYVINQPKYQTKIAHNLTESLSEQYGTKITIDNVYFKFFNKATLNKIYIEDTKGDTLFYAGKVDTRISVFDPFNNTFRIEQANFDDVKIRINAEKNSPKTNLKLLLEQIEEKSGSKKTSTQQKEKKPLYFNVRKANFNNFDLLVNNQYKHQYQVVKLPQLKASFKEFDLNKKQIRLHYLRAKQPTIQLVKTKYIPQAKNVKTRFGTPKDWAITVGKLSIENGAFKSKGKDKGVERAKQFMFNDFDMKNLHVAAENISAKNNKLGLLLQNLSFKDSSGFEVEFMNAQTWFTNQELGFKNLQLKTPESTIQGDVLFDVNYLEDFSDFENQINIDANLVDVKLVPTDLAYLFGKSPTQEPVYIKGEANGKISNLDTKNFELRFEHGSLLRGDISVRGLPDVMNAYFDAKVDKLYTTTEGIRLIARADKLPKEIAKFGTINYEGEFTGYLTNLVGFGTITTDIGTFETDVQYNGQNGKKEYNGYLASKDFQLGYWLEDEEQFGTIDFSGSVKGNEFDLTKMNTLIDAKINSIDFRNANYKDVAINGRLKQKVFDGVIIAKDEQLNATIDGWIDFSSPKTTIEFTSDIENINLKQLRLTQDNILVHGKFNAQLSGSSLDTLRGKIEAKDTKVMMNGKPYEVEELFVNLSDNQKGQQLIQVSTGTIDAEIKGKYEYSKLANTFLKTINNYYDFQRGWENLENTINTNETIGFKIKVAKEDTLLEQLIDGLKINADIVAEGDVNPNTKEVSLVGATEDIGYNNFSITGWEFDAIGDGQTLFVNSFQNELYNNGKQWFVDSELNFEFDGDELLADIRTYNEEFLDAKLTTRLTRLNKDEFKLSILTSDLIIAEQNWTIEEGNSIIFGGEQWRAENFVLTNDAQKIEIYAPETKSNVKLIVQVLNFNMTEVNTLVGFTKKPFSGTLNGEVRLVQEGKDVILDNDLYVSNLMYNNDIIDRTNIEGDFNLNKGIGVFKGELIDADFKADLSINIDLKDQKETVVIGVDLEKASLSPFENLWGSSISEVKGYVNGYIKVTGNPSHFNVDGNVTLIEDLGVTLNFTQAHYTAEKGQSIDINEEGFYLDALKLKDEFGHEAILNGGILHNNLSAFKVDLVGQYENFLFLNTTSKDNEVFYGTAYADGFLSFTGPIEDVVLNIKATTRENTTINITPQASEEIGEYDFIRFKKPITDTVEIVKSPSKSKLTMLFDLDITPVADLFMSFDESEYNTLRGNGAGNLRVNFDTQGLLEIFGIYNVTQGAYVVNFEEVLTKRFAIQEGGSIRWNGDPYSAILDIDAVYNVNADITQLLNEGTSVGTATGTSKTPTNITVNLSESLDKPRFTYEIDVPDATTGGFINEQVKAINRNKDLLDRQLFSLLLLDRFSGNTTNPFEGDVAFDNLAINSVTNIIANQLTSLISEVDALRNTDIGIDFESYRDKFIDPTNGNNTGLDQQIQLSVAQQIGQKVRLSVGSDFNFGKELSDENEVFQVRDIIMEVDINSDGKYELKFFVKQDYSISSQENDYRNGVSYVFEKEYKSFKDIFRKKTKIEKEAIENHKRELERIKQQEKEKRKQQRKEKRNKVVATKPE